MLDGTYAGLVESIAGWLDRSDMAARIPDYIVLAEAQISRRLLMDGPVRSMMAKTPITISAEYTNIPVSDFMGVKSLYLTGGTSRVIEPGFLEPDLLTREKTMRSQQAGDPKWFSIVGDQVQVFPVPSTPLTGEMVYWQRIPTITGDNPNWLLVDHPDAYLYGALLQAAPYLSDDTRIPIWTDAFGTVLADIIAADKIERSASTLAVPTVSGGVF